MLTRTSVLQRPLNKPPPCELTETTSTVLVIMVVEIMGLTTHHLGSAYAL